MGNYCKKILFLISFAFLSFSILPNNVLGDEWCDSEERTITTKQESEVFTFWSVSWIGNLHRYGESSLSYNILIKKPKNQYPVGDGWKLEVLTDETRWFSPGDYTSESALKWGFVNLNVEDAYGNIDCGGPNVVGQGFENCGNNDYCNYMCKKISDDPDMTYENATTQTAKDNNIAYRYNNTGWESCLTGSDPSDNCTLYKRFIGWNGSSSSEHVRTSIQSRAYKLFTSSVKAGSYRVIVDNQTNDPNYDKVNISINDIDNSGYHSFNTEREWYKVDKAFEITKTIVGANNLRKKVTLYQTEFLPNYKPTPFFVPEDFRALSVPVVFKYKYVKTTTKTVRNCIRTSNEVTSENGECSQATYKTPNQYTCSCNGGNNFSYTPIKYRGTQFNRYCYLDCSRNEINLNGPGLVAGLNISKIVSAGQNFDWDVSINYDVSCDVVIDQDKYAKAGKTSLDTQMYNRCFDYTPTVGKVNEVKILNFQYGDKKSDVRLGGNNLDAVKTCYNKNRQLIDCGSKSEISTINFSLNGSVSYNTDQFRYINKGSGLAGSVNDANTVESKYMLPVHFTEKTTNNNERKKLTVQAKIDDKYITHQCYYGITNLLFGYECLNGNDCSTARKREDGVDLIFRPISLTEPFPGQSGAGQTSTGQTRRIGENWNKEFTNYVNDVITSKADIYENPPIYSIRLDANAINDIRNYNNQNAYNDFNMTCDTEGKNCIGNVFLSDNVEVTGSCANIRDRSEFEECRNNP